MDYDFFFYVMFVCRLHCLPRRVLVRLPKAIRYMVFLHYIVLLFYSFNNWYCIYLLFISGILAIESFYHKMFPYWIISRKLLYTKYFHKTLFVGFLESASLWAEMPVEVRLPTTGSPQTPQKQDPHWELLFLLLYIT